MAKKKFLATFFSGSLLGGVIAAGATYYFENRKIEYQIIRLQQSEQREVYSSLAKDLQKLESDLNTAVMTFKYAIDHPKEQNFRHNVDQSIDALTDQMAVINTALLSPQIEVKVKTPVTSLLNQLGPTLMSAQQNRRALPGLVQLHNQTLRQQISDIKTQIEAKRKELPIEPHK